jgi:hypothetical protein
VVVLTENASVETSSSDGWLENVMRRDATPDLSR